MFYKDQLILTGKINDVGAYTRTNIPDSYRTGIELQAGVKLNNMLSLSGNITLSKNKVKNFTEYIDDYDNGGQAVNQYKSTDIAFSPKMISSISANIVPLQHALLTLTGKYVSSQFLDNTSNETRMLRAYYSQDARASYSIAGKTIKQTEIFAQLNNVFSRKYEPSGYTFSYISGGLTTENYYFPMAPINWVVGVNLKF
jgi:iron complex outermembrane receptor protein